MAKMNPVTFIPVVFCDDCGKQQDDGIVYDSPWKDNKVRCAECFLISEGYTRESIDATVNRIVNTVHHYLASVNHDRQFNIQKRGGIGSLE